MEELTKDVLLNLYVEEGKSTHEIAEMFGYKTAKSISDKLRNFNVPVRKKLKDSERIGRRKFNTNGAEMEVVVYNTNRDIWVKFLEHGNMVHTTWTLFCKGEVRNPYDKTLFGVGFLGVGTHKANTNKKYTPQYSQWSSMLRRAYDEKTLKKQSFLCWLYRCG